LCQLIARPGHQGKRQSPPGGIASLATTIRDALYNSGSGRLASSISDATKTAWGVPDQIVVAVVAKLTL
jgi:hypothetical protein